MTGQRPGSGQGPLGATQHTLENTRAALNDTAEIEARVAHICSLRFQKEKQGLSINQPTGLFLNCTSL